MAASCAAMTCSTVRGIGSVSQQAWTATRPGGLETIAKRRQLLDRQVACPCSVHRTGRDPSGINPHDLQCWGILPMRRDAVLPMVTAWGTDDRIARRRVVVHSVACGTGGGCGGPSAASAPPTSPVPPTSAAGGAAITPTESSAQQCSISRWIISAPAGEPGRFSCNGNAEVVISNDPGGLRLEYAGTQYVMAVGERRTIGPYLVQVVTTSDGSLGVAIG